MEVIKQAETEHKNNGKSKKKKGLNLNNLY